MIYLVFYLAFEFLDAFFSLARGDDHLLRGEAKGLRELRACARALRVGEFVCFGERYDKGKFFVFDEIDHVNVEFLRGDAYINEANDQIKAPILIKIAADKIGPALALSF